MMYGDNIIEVGSDDLPVAIIRVESFFGQHVLPLIYANFLGTVFIYSDGVLMLDSVEINYLCSHQPRLSRR
jgi:hypothetical protein